jgi:lambda family phage portal protein
MGVMSSLLSGARRGIMAFAGFGGSAYAAGRYDMPETAGWHKQQRHAESGWSDGNDAIAGRAEDSDRNNSWINGGLDRDVEATVGTGLKLYPTPLYAAFNKDYEWGAKWGEAVLAQYRVWAEDPLKRCDANMRMSLGELERLAYLNYKRTGEVLFEIRKNDRGSTNPTNIMLIDPKRIENPTGSMLNNPKIRNGIEYQGTVPVAAWVRPFHPDDTRSDKGLNEPVRVAFRTSTGTPKLVLISNTRFIEQVRGVSPLAGSLTVSKNLDSYEKDVANRAKLEIQMGAYIKSPGSSDDVSEAIAPGSGLGQENSYASYLDWRNKNPVKSVAGLFIRHLFRDEDIVFTPPQTPGNNYPILRKSELSKMSSQMGLSYPELSQDHEGINLSNARAIDNRRYKTVLQNREIWSRQFNMAIYIAWMEEEVAAGGVKIPGGPVKFYTHLSAVTNSNWVGPGKGTIDPMKEENGRNLKEAANRGSPIQHILEENRYPSEVWDEIAYSRGQMESRNLSSPDYNTKGQPSDGEDGGTGPTGNPADGDKDGIPNEADKKKAKPTQGGNE